MLLAAIFNNFTLSPQLYRHSGTDIPPQVPDIDNQPGDEDLYVPGSASYTLTNSEEVADMGNNESALLAIGLIA